MLLRIQIAVVTIQLLSENEIVLETDGTVHICLTKDLDTDQSFQAEVTVREIISSESNSATGTLKGIVHNTFTLCMGRTQEQLV